MQSSTPLGWSADSSFALYSFTIEPDEGKGAKAKAIDETTTNKLD